MTITAPDPAPPSPPVTIPSDPPSAVSAVPGDSSAVVAWIAPTSSGSFPVTHYLASSSPRGRTCLVAVPTVSCEISGLSNGTSYTFTVQALTGAGWSASSAPSNAVTPAARVAPKITITGAREGRQIYVSGATSGMGPGGQMTTWISRSGADWIRGREVALSESGGFAWSRRANPEAMWRVYFSAEGSRSNTVTIR